jgi:hypothetical protein
MGWVWESFWGHDGFTKWALFAKRHERNLLATTCVENDSSRVGVKGQSCLSSYVHLGNVCGIAPFRRYPRLDFKNK